MCNVLSHDDEEVMKIDDCFQKRNGSFQLELIRTHYFSSKFLFFLNSYKFNEVLPWNSEGFLTISKDFAQS